MIGAVVLAGLIANAPGPLPSPWSNWKYVRSIDTRRANGTVTIAVPPSIYANARPSLDDVRILGSDGAAVPFAIETPAPVAPERWTDATLTDRGFVAGRYSQAVADLGAVRHTYSTLDIATPAGGFAAHVDVDASDDGVTWRTIRTGAPIYDYRQDGLATNTRVSFPTSTARYLRVRVLDGSTAFPISGIQVALANGAPEITRYSLRLGPPTHNATEKTTSYVLTGIDEVPTERIRVDSASPRFVRTVDVEVSQDGASWQTVASAPISRVEPGRDALSIAFDETQAARWRVVVHDGDNAALRDVRIDAYGTPRRIYFDAQPGTSYRLIYGNPSAAAPVFDYSKTHGAATLGRATAVALGIPMLNPSFVSSTPAKPWSDRYPWILWSALAVAVLGIGTLAVRTMAPEPPAP